MLKTRGVKTSHSGLVVTTLAQNARESGSIPGGGSVQLMLLSHPGVLMLRKLTHRIIIYLSWLVYSICIHYLSCSFNFMLWFLLLFSYSCLLNYLCRTFSYDISLLSISSFLGHIGFPFHFMLLHTHFVLAWFSLYPAGTVGISFSNTLFSYVK